MCGWSWLLKHRSPHFLVPPRPALDRKEVLQSMHLILVFHQPDRVPLWCHWFQGQRLSHIFYAFSSPGCVNPRKHSKFGHLEKPSVETGLDEPDWFVAGSTMLGLASRFLTNSTSNRDLSPRWRA